MSTALVTGGTGFIGSNLVEGLIEKGIKVRVMRREKSSLTALEGLAYEAVSGDISGSEDALQAAVHGCDWVFHVAAISDYWRHSSEVLYRINVEGTKKLMAAAMNEGVSRFIYTSSISALGVPEPGRLLNESSQFNLSPARFPYAHSKHLAELAVMDAAERGLPAVILNLPIVIGARDVNQVSGSIIIEAARGRLRFFFPGGSNFVAVGDVVAGHIAAAERELAEKRYVIAGENLTYTQAIERVCRVVGRPRPKLTVPAALLPVIAAGVAIGRRIVGNRIPIDPNQVRLSGQFLFVDGSRARERLGLPGTPFEAAVQSAYDWYKACGIL